MTTEKLTTNEHPSYDETVGAFDVIKRSKFWDIDHDLRDFVLASRSADVSFDASRMAAYRLMGKPAPLGYYDDAIDRLHAAIEMLLRQRAIDHGDAPVQLHPAAASSQAMRDAIAVEA